MRLILLVLFAVFFSVSTHASTVNYRLYDHGQGALGPNYGVRVDVLAALVGIDPTTFSASTNGGNLLLSYDDMALTASISGTVSSNDTGEILDLAYTLSGLTARTDGGFTATGGDGNINGSLNGTDLDFDFDAKQNGSGIAATFAFDGHRLPNDTTTGVFRGWFVNTNRPCCNDFLVQAAVVPLPVPLALLVTSLVGLGWVARRRRTV